MASDGSGTTDGLAVIGTTVRILEELEGQGGTGVTTLAERLDLPKSTVHTHLRSWAEAGYLTREGDRYAISPGFLRFGGDTVSNHPIIAAGQTAIDELAMETEERVQVVDEHEGRGVYVYQARGRRALPTDTHVGSRVHMHCTASGKAILAFLPAERRDEILEAHGLPEWTRNTITDRDALTEELAQIRETGLAFDDEERVEGVRCVAAPVLDDAERPYGALTISASTRTLRGDAFREEYPELVSDTATSIQLQATYS